MIRIRLLAAISLACVVGCGGDSTAPDVTELQLVSVDGKALPALIYTTGSETGRIVAGTLTASPDPIICNFTLSLNRTIQGNSAGSGTSSATGGAQCTWNSSGSAVAAIDLGSPWAKHSYTFVK